MLAWISSLVPLSPTDSEDQVLEKKVLVYGSLLVAAAATVWGTIFLYYGEVAAAALSLGYMIFTLIGLIYVIRTGRYRWFQFLQYLSGLVFPFTQMIVLGGFWQSGAVLIWSIFSPLATLLFYSPRTARLWWLAFLALFGLAGVLEATISHPNQLPENLIIAFTVLNFTVVSTMIAAALKNDAQPIAEQFDEASVLFADLVDFTPLSSQLSPVEMVELLNEIFSQFDELVEQYNVEKIRTIGDNYMVAAGVPRPQPDHAERLARLALDMRRYLEAKWADGEPPVQFRIGINSGSVIGGVIGRRKFVYDVWGDAVNVASRMESHSLPGKIQIAKETFHRLQGTFVCQPRGMIEVKGKGQMQTWFLEGSIHG
jgi:guanylate cyclase